jgi:hypothetical protein
MAVGNQVGKTFNIPPATLANPTITANIAQTTGGTLALTTYYIRYTWITANGETAPSAEQSVTLTGSNNALNITVASQYWVSGATGMNIYVSTTSGGESLQYTQTTVGATYTLTSLSLTGNPVPQWNTTSFQDINPSVLGLATGSEFIVHNIYYNNPIALGTFDGTTKVMFDTDNGNGARLGMAIHCNGNQWLRLYNTGSTSSMQVSFDGIQTV